MSGYSQEVMNGLIYDNPFFKEPAEKRYQLFKDVDPFPNISASLLNSEDIIKYIMTTGMIDHHFNIEELKGATYNCEISGEYIFWNEEKVQVKETLKSEDDFFTIPSNSIMFIAIKPTFRIPLYMVLRFNLKVSHVYKGLLLGTGPIVDPGFVGQLYIPLHNLTSNAYVIKKNALMIAVEFTKMSPNPNWEIKPNSDQEKIVKSLHFRPIKYEHEKIPANRPFSEYIEKALTKDPLFYKHEPKKLFINSSLSEKIQKFGKEIEKFKENIKKNEKTIKTDSEKMAKTENFVKSFTWIATLGVIVACLSLAGSAAWFLYNSSKVTESQKNIEKQLLILLDFREFQEQRYINAQKIFNTKVDEMQEKINDLEKKIKENKTSETKVQN